MTPSCATLAASCLQVVVIRGDGSPWWEETSNRTFDVPEAGDGLAVTCHMGGDGATDVAAGGGSAAAAPAKPSRDDEFHSAIDMSVDMEDARKLNPAFNVQVLYWPLGFRPTLLTPWQRLAPCMSSSAAEPAFLHHPRFTIPFAPSPFPRPLLRPAQMPRLSATTLSNCNFIYLSLSIAIYRYVMQASYDGAEGNEVQGDDEPAVESEQAELVEAQVCREFLQDSVAFQAQTRRTSTLQAFLSHRLPGNRLHRSRGDCAVHARMQSSCDKRLILWNFFFSEKFVPTDSPVVLD